MAAGGLNFGESRVGTWHVVLVSMVIKCYYTTRLDIEFMSAHKFEFATSYNNFIFIIV